MTTDSISPATLADVARLAGVSKMTASNVINGKPGMSEATRQRVLGAIQQSGYVVNPAARVLAGRRMNLIGVMAPMYNSPYVTELMQGASAAAEDAGMTLAVLTTSGNEALERERGALLRTLADGVLLILPTDDEPQVFRGVVPVVMAGGMGTYGVQSDNRHGGHLAARHLLELGHRRIAHIRGATVTALNREEAAAREQGFLEVLGEAGVSVPAEYLRDGDFSESGGQAAAEALLRLPEPPTAIFAANDSTAFGVLRAAERLGVRVPGDLSLVGFDDVTSSALTTPALTTVRQPLQEMGAAAVRMLLALTRGEPPAEPHLLFPTTLVVRDSTAPPGAATRLPRRARGPT
ncbi:LacI family transcriptional regulator (plasmid) [Deinococcus aetherius]|uniref:LacI family transcriptional regulator n=1 Tax=Deinococcus aetherius TaxID=200252 RepID=A0ABN6RJN0_9DEIO|nr:LacI family DNA-binding transcriptional regulator [Deinococcus aetherius]BDP43547.1 LacI family transcriptional regulator [Deinococcus aetherius]